MTRPPEQDDVPPSADDGVARAMTLPAEPGAAVARARAEEALFGKKATDVELGRFVLLGEVGRGAMGVVYRAYDPQLDRKVAIKVLPSYEDGDGSQGHGRAMREAQALARLNHPNVVTVHEVGRYGAGIFLAMEFVEGRTLRRWLDAEARDWKAILDVFVDAGRGLIAAHERDLVHRDFKPDNVMVGADRVVVMDFGLVRARAAPEPADDAPMSEASEDGNITLTETGRVVGTPAYMAPEQFAGEPAEPATDQFAFCVALWEALFGERPFPGDSVSELSAAVGLGRRRPVPRRSGVPRWLVDTVDRGLDVDPAARWPSMAALLENVEAHRRRARRLPWLVAAGVVLLAGATFYAVRAADRAQLCSGATAQLAGVWDEPRRVAAEQAVLAIGASYATGVWDRTSAALDAYAAAWAEMHRDTCEATTLRGEQSPTVMDLRMACLQGARAELSALGELLADADAEVVEKADELAAGLRPLSRCADIEALQAEVEPPPEGEANAVEAAREHLARARAVRAAGRLDAARAELDTAYGTLSEITYVPIRAEVMIEDGALLQEVGDYPESEETLREALRLAAGSHQWRLVGTAARVLLNVVGVSQQHYEEGLRYADLALSLTEDDTELHSAVHNVVGMVRQEQGKYAEAAAAYEESIRLLEQAEGASEATTGNVRTHLAFALSSLGKNAEAEATQRRTVAVLEQEYGPDHPLVGSAHDILGVILMRGKGPGPETEAEFRTSLAVFGQAYGHDHPEVASAETSLGVVLLRQGKFAEARELLEHAAAVFERSLGPDHPRLAIAWSNIASVLGEEGKHGEAQAKFRQALELMVNARGPDHPDVATVRSNLAGELRLDGKIDEAEVQERLGLEGRVKAFGAEHPDTAISHNNLGLLLHTQGKYAEAEAEHRRALAIREKVLDQGHPHVASSHGNLGLTLLAEEKYREAETELRKSVEMYEASVGPEHPSTISMRTGLGQVFFAEGKLEEAREAAETAWRHTQEQTVTDLRRGETAFLLARVLWDLPPDAGRDRPRALDLAAQARAAYIAGGTGAASWLERLNRWLEQHRG